MKYYQTHFEEYTKAIEEHDMHPELIPVISKIPYSLIHVGNMILFGPSGCGKYSQALRIIQRYSPSKLKYEKRLKVQTDKNSITCRLSDIHYEVDFALLGCNPKSLWHEIFSQIVDIICVKPDKSGIILCKNFHCIHSELMDIFYSYMQQYNTPFSNIDIKFVIITEHISFIHNNIVNACQVISVKRPSKEHYVMSAYKNGPSEVERNRTVPSFLRRIGNLVPVQDNITKMKEYMAPIDLMNIKEVRGFSLVKNADEIPSDIFNVVCSNIIKELEEWDNIKFANFRDIIYDILIYNLDATECFWNVLTHFIREGRINDADVKDILDKSYSFLKHYNNNYRPIYHLESMFIYIIIKLNCIDESIGSM